MEIDGELRDASATAPYEDCRLDCDAERDGPASKV